PSLNSEVSYRFTQRFSLIGAGNIRHSPPPAKPKVESDTTPGQSELSLHVWFEGGTKISGVIVHSLRSSEEKSITLFIWSCSFLSGLPTSFVTRLIPRGLNSLIAKLISVPLSASGAPNTVT